MILKNNQFTGEPDNIKLGTLLKKILKHLMNLQLTENFLMG